LIQGKKRLGDDFDISVLDRDEIGVVALEAFNELVS
jgi:hypothetical protein